MRRTLHTLWLSSIILCAPACGRVSFASHGGRDGAAPDSSTGAPDTSAGDTSTVTPDADADADGGDAGRPEPTVADTGSFPYRIAADDTNVYWVDFADGSLHRLPLAGGPSTELVPARPSPEPYGLHVGDGNVYLCDTATGEIRRVGVAGGPVDVIAVSPCNDLVADGTHLYWSSVDVSEPTIRRLSLPDGAPEDVGAPGAARNLTLAGSDLYWTNYGGGEVVTLPTSGGTARVLANVDLGGPWGLSVDANFVYWAEHQVDVGRVARIPRAGGAVETLAAAQNGAHAVALDGQVTYWTNEFAGTISRLRPGEAPVEIAVGQDRPLNLVVTANAVYWTTRGGDVMRLDK